MLNKDVHFLEEAYLSITKKNQNLPIPSEEEIVTTAPNKIVSSGPVTEPAPGVDMDMVDPAAEKDTTGIPVKMDSEPLPNLDSLEQNHTKEHEEDEMVLDNLNSLRESIVKIASFCSTGGHLEAWQQQKLAISMDNLAEIARSLH